MRSNERELNLVLLTKKILQLNFIIIIGVTSAQFLWLVSFSNRKSKLPDLRVSLVIACHFYAP